MNSLTAFLLDVSTTVSSGSGEAAAQGTQQAAGGGLFGGMNGFTLVIIYCVALVIIMYFLSFRPTQKREKALAEQRNAIQIGDMVVTNAGMYGKVVDTTYDCFIIEFGLNKGVRVPVAVSYTHLIRRSYTNRRNSIWLRSLYLHRRWIFLGDI